jgi:hypothetical protein
LHEQPWEQVTHVRLVGFIAASAGCEKSHFPQAAQKSPDARPPGRFSPAGQAGNPEE